MLNYNDEETVNTVIKFLEMENLGFDELKKILNELEIHGHLNGSCIWGILARWINDNTKHPSRKQYKKPVFSDKLYNGSVNITDYMTHSYIYGMIEIIKDETGGGVDGTPCELIIRHIDSGRYLVKYGEFDSYDGQVNYYCDWLEVKPVHIETIEYKVI